MVNGIINTNSYGLGSTWNNTKLFSWVMPGLSRLFQRDIEIMTEIFLILLCHMFEVTGKNYTGLNFFIQ